MVLLTWEKKDIEETEDSHTVYDQWKYYLLKAVDMLCMTNGGQCIRYSNADFGHPHNLMLPHPPQGQGYSDGWETSRNVSLLFQGHNAMMAGKLL